MGFITHLITFGAGIYIGTKINTPTEDGQEPWVRINSSGVKVGEKDLVKITDDSIEFGNGIAHWDRKSEKRD